jgi:hypothetical protein
MEKKVCELLDFKKETELLLLQRFLWFNTFAINKYKNWF